MFPISLNLASVPILLVGEGEAFEKRKRQLLEMSAEKLYCHPAEGRDPRLSLNEWFGVDASLRWHDSVVIMVAGLDVSTSEMITREARKQKKLVNVEDVPELCDFYFTSFVARGELTIAVSTNGASPTLAKRVRDKIASIFGEEWGVRTYALKQLRNRLREEGKNMGEVMAESEKFLDDLLYPERREAESKDLFVMSKRSLGYARDKVL